MVGRILMKKLIKNVYPNLKLIKIHKNIIQNKNQKTTANHPQSKNYHNFTLVKLL